MKAPNTLIGVPVAALAVVVLLVNCAQPENGVQFEDKWVSYDDYSLKPHYRAAAMGWCASRADYGFIAWGAPTAEEAVSKVIEVCKNGTPRSFLQKGTCQLCRLGDTDLRGLTQVQIEKAITIYNSNRFATSYDMVGRANPEYSFEEWIRKRLERPDVYGPERDRGLLR